MDYLVRFGEADLADLSVELHYERQEAEPWCVTVNRDLGNGRHRAVLVTRGTEAPSMEQCAWLASWTVEGRCWWPGKKGDTE